MPRLPDDTINQGSFHQNVDVRLAAFTTSPKATEGRKARS